MIGRAVQAIRGPAQGVGVAGRDNQGVARGGEVGLLEGLGDGRAGGLRSLGRGQAGGEPR